MSDKARYPITSPTGTITVNVHGFSRVLRLAGEIDHAVVDDYWNDHSLDEVGRFSIVDISQVTFINSYGLSFLADQTKASRSAGSPVFLRGASPRVRQLLEITGLDQLFHQVGFSEAPDDGAWDGSRN